MSNMFYIPVRDEAGNIQAGVSVGAYTDLACTSLATLVAPGPTANPFTTDSDGDQFIYVTNASTEMLYFRAVGQTVVVPIRCANLPLFSDYTADASPDSGSLFVFEDSGTRKKITLAELIVALGVPASVMTGVNTTKITVSTGSAGSSGSIVEGDIWAKVPS